jgi:hypothetical protein
LANIDLPPIGVRETGHRSCQRLGYAAQRDVQRLRDIAVAKPLSAQEQTLSIALGKCANDGAKLAHTPIVGELLFGIRRRIDHAIDEPDVPRTFPAMPPRRLLAMLERLIVSDAEDPPTQVRP